MVAVINWCQFSLPVRGSLVVFHFAIQQKCHRLTNLNDVKRNGK